MLDLRPHFSLSLSATPDRLHFAAHSHHPRPDVTRAAQLAAWDDAARLLDGKWEHVLGPVWQAAQRHVARHLRLPDPATVVFAPNTQEFVVRILSALPVHRPPRILTTDGEFHSFSRQVARMEEEGLVAVTRIPSEPARDCLPRLVEAARAGFDLVWTSEVFFTSGAALDDFSALAAASGEAALVIDGYHAFLARPVDLSAVADRAFYLAGGYKYAMAGEGACFLHCPPGWLPRPRATGWYAGFGALSEASAGVPYAEDGWRFMGSTFDTSGIYRLNAVMDWLAAMNLDAAAIHAHAQALQARFVAGLPRAGLDPARLVVPLADPARGNFLAFDLEDAEARQARLAAAGIVTDRRGRRLRFGFGLYQTEEEVDRLLERLETAGATA
ncbi:aminotransferase class V-fold PLP-dependent enzyme [Belnapia rosea]|uniref:Selenocysteine lyase/Cysteine desulfurase n=1 Tax=Belnapia rosea TaxID=938405 RepID=A0A1G7AEZ4_9PROT|nr:aminotransferase class V-fold PLP-dependent enzyme [Belnapia rosea]SDE13494.1 Selenocysteine lyase/Cysteine desulfurase [Belnapia rosea]